MRTNAQFLPFQKNTSNLCHRDTTLAVIVTVAIIRQCSEKNEKILGFCEDQRNEFVPSRNFKLLKIKAGVCRQGKPFYYSFGRSFSSDCGVYRDELGCLRSLIRSMTRPVLLFC